MLTLERLREIETASVQEKTFNGLKSLISAYRSVARAAASVSKEDEAKREELLELQKSTREKAKKKIAKAVQKIRSVQVEYTIEDPAVASKAISITLSNMGELLEHHADASNSKKQGFVKSEFVVPGLTEKVGLPPTSYNKWIKMKIVARAFFTETLCLLDQSIGASHSDANLQILRFLAEPQRLKWVMPFGRLSERVLAHLCRLWMSSAPAVRLQAFLALRAFIAVVGFPQHASEVLKGSNKKGEEDEDEDASDDEAELGATRKGKSFLVGVARVDAIVQRMYRTLVQSASKAATWRGCSAVRFGLNCFGEVLRLNPGVAYRAAFQGVRQLALLTRQAVLPNPPKQTEKQKKHAPDGALLTWAFVTGCRVWAHVLSVSLAASSSSSSGAFHNLHELAYPLCTVLTAALKLKMTSNEYAPFCLHLLATLNQVSAAASLHVPCVGFAVTVLTHLSSLVQKARKNLNAQSAANAKGGKATRLQKGIADVDLLLKLKNEHMESMQVVEAACERTLDVITQSLALLARNPGFPEASLPVLALLRRAGKAMESDYVRRKVKELIASVEATAEELRTTRENTTVARPAEGRVRTELLVVEPSAAPALASKYAAIEGQREKRVQEGVAAEEAAAALEKRAEELEARKGQMPVGKKAKQEMIRGLVADAKDKGREDFLERQRKRGGSAINKSGGNKVFKRGAKKFGGKAAGGAAKRFKKA